MHYKVIDSTCEYRQSDGRPVYTVTIACKNGTFTSTCCACDEDLVYGNDDCPINLELSSYYIAEYKCVTKALQRKARYLEQRVIGIKMAYDALAESFSMHQQNDDYIHYGKTKFDNLFERSCYADGYDTALCDLLRQYESAYKNYDDAQDEYIRHKDGLYTLVDKIRRRNELFLEYLNKE